MNDMQWALLFIGVIVVMGVYFHARRQAAKQAVWNNKRKRENMEEDQLDFFEQDDSGGFDEFGVGKARTARKAPVLDEPAIPQGKPKAAPPAEKPARRGEKAKPKGDGLFVISVYRTDMNFVPGEDVHQALESCGLQFGEHNIYHRFSPRGEAVFSVASLVKPGFLVPADKDELRTPGVSMFLQLPGALEGEAAFDDFLATAQALANRWDGTLLDRQRQPLTIESIENMRKACAAYAAK